MSLFAEAIQRGNRASQPAAGAVVIGALYYVTDENVTERSNGSAWEDFSDVSAAAVDSDDVTYVPTTLADWDGSADPGDVEQALDQLAERVTDIEAAGAVIADGDKGDITTSSSGAVWTIDNGAVTEAKQVLADNTTQDVSTTKHGYVPKLTAPGAGVRNVAAIDNGETALKITALLDTSNAADIGTAAPGTSLIAARKDHVHAIPSGGVTVAQQATGAKTGTIIVVIDGGGATITTGIKGDIEVPIGITITQATLLADQSGSIVIDIWKDSYANYPPTDADSITASAPPTISTATKSQDATLTGWTTSVSAGDILRFNVDSVTTIQRVTLSLKYTKA